MRKAISEQFARGIGAKRVAGLAVMTLAAASAAWAQDETTADTVQTHANILWTLVAAILVF